MVPSVVTETRYKIDLTMANKIETVKKLLKKIAKEQNYDKPEITVTETSSRGANFSSKLFVATIKEENKEDLNLFAKVGILGERIRKNAEVIVYDTERFFYSKLAKIYESLEEENAVPAEHRLHFTKCYGFDPQKYEETIVLDNLVEQGYQPHNRFESYDLPYAKASISCMAKMHALSIAYSRKDPEEFAKTLEIIKYKWRRGAMDDMMQSTIDTALHHVNPENKASLEKYLKRDDIKHDFLANLYAPVGIKAIIHADFRGSNLLHKEREDGTVDVKIVDLQHLQGGSPVTDLIYFLYTGSDQEFRAKHFDNLVIHYFDELTAAMKRLKLKAGDLYPKSQFEAEMKEKLQYVMGIAVYTLPLITIEPENAPVPDENMEVSALMVTSDKTSELYTVRLNGVVKDCLKWGHMKEA